MQPALTLAAESSALTAVDLLVVLATAGAVALLFGRFKMPAPPGYLIAGAIVGPFGIGLVKDPDAIEGLGHLSTILLMFIVGLHLDMTRVRVGLYSIVGTACVATLLMVLLAWPIAGVLTSSAPAGLAIAMTMAIAATAVPLRTLETRREMNAPHGRLAFGITLFQDLLAVAMLAMLPLLARWKGGSATPSNDWLHAARQGIIGVGGLAVLVAIGKFALPWLLGHAGKAGGEVLIVVSAAIALGAAVLSSLLGFSPELGAFLAGFLLAATGVRHQIAGQLVPMRDLFLAVFFTIVGMSIPLLDVLGGWWVVLLGLLALGVVKILGVTLSAWVFGSTPRVGFLAAVTLAPAGEFSLVMLAQALEKGALDPAQVGYATAIVGLSIVAAPIIVWLGHRAQFIARWPAAPWIRRAGIRSENASHSFEALEFGETAAHAIVGGFGPVGRAVAEELERLGLSITIVELNARTVEKQATLGRTIVYGDISNAGVLEAAGVQNAEAVILAAPDDDAMLRACERVRALRPDVMIVVRVTALSQGLKARTLGADHFVVEEIVTARAMAADVVELVRCRREGRPMATPSTA